MGRPRAQLFTVSTLGSGMTPLLPARAGNNFKTRIVVQNRRALAPEYFQPFAPELAMTAAAVRQSGVHGLLEFQQSAHIARGRAARSRGVDLFHRRAGQV